MSSKPDIVFSLFCPGHEIAGELVQLIMLVVKGFVLELEILELFVLILRV